MCSSITFSKILENLRNIFIDKWLDSLVAKFWVWDDFSLIPSIQNVWLPQIVIDDMCNKWENNIDGGKN